MAKINFEAWRKKILEGQDPLEALRELREEERLKRGLEECKHCKACAVLCTTNAPAVRAWSSSICRAYGDTKPQYRQS